MDMVGVEDADAPDDGDAEAPEVGLADAPDDTDGAADGDGDFVREREDVRDRVAFSERQCERYCNSLPSTADTCEGYHNAVI